MVFNAYRDRVGFDFSGARGKCKMTEAVHEGCAQTSSSQREFTTSSIDQESQHRLGSYEPLGCDTGTATTAANMHTTKLPGLSPRHCLIFLTDYSRKGRLHSHMRLNRSARAPTSRTNLRSLMSLMESCKLLAHPTLNSGPFAPGPCLPVPGLCSP